MSPGIDEAINKFYQKGGKDPIRHMYRFSPIDKKGNYIRDDKGLAERHMQALKDPMLITTGGYTAHVSLAPDGSLSILVMNRMSINSLFGHVGDVTGVNVNYSRFPTLQPQPLSTTQQFFLISRPGR